MDTKKRKQKKEIAALAKLCAEEGNGFARAIIQSIRDSSI
jgi:hypothetical protein